MQFIGHLIKQKPYEKIEYSLHRHPITFFPKILIFIFMMAVPAGVYFLFINIFPDLFQTEIYYTLAVLLASIYFLSIYLYAYGEFVDFYLDMWIVTNDRVIDIEQIGLFSRTVTEFDLYNIQDLTVNITGFFHTLLNYGDIDVKTASGNTHIIFRNIPNPNEVRQSMIQLAESDRQYHLKQSR
ncbi:MAG: hypothetical protein US42_C0018G0003 [Candidatus Magasanikbacteria bacterium GW2011_GWC2_37_14]|uniref:YdbS-like PH domain-containing protein n=1 Tax=Candidatus Magasanikbacteria bacterium GW2011_GWC2_37_14 TaxID=1619046 RepID=A0A0G0IRY0_9BACT|nr:MAG: hypothetical protein US42_C0018G0003 [Candidatus Magasanikbacteria bacterium GW2011_GWC2_37_14]